MMVLNTQTHFRGQNKMPTSPDKPNSQNAFTFPKCSHSKYINIKEERRKMAPITEAMKGKIPF